MPGRQTSMDIMTLISWVAFAFVLAYCLSTSSSKCTFIAQYWIFCWYDDVQWKRWPDVRRIQDAFYCLGLYEVATFDCTLFLRFLQRLLNSLQSTAVRRSTLRLSQYSDIFILARENNRGYIDNPQEYWSHRHKPGPSRWNWRCAIPMGCQCMSVHP